MSETIESSLETTILSQYSINDSLLVPAPGTVSNVSLLEKQHWDIIKAIGHYIPTSTLVNLARSSRGLYTMVQPLLWRHPRLSSVDALMKFTKHLDSLPPLDLIPPLVENWDDVLWERKAQLQTLHLHVDDILGFDELASDHICKISRLCPAVKISLTLTIKGCLPRIPRTGSPYYDTGLLTKNPGIVFPCVRRIEIFTKEETDTSFSVGDVHQNYVMLSTEPDRPIVLGLRDVSNDGDSVSALHMQNSRQ